MDVRRFIKLRMTLGTKELMADDAEVKEERKTKKSSSTAYGKTAWILMYLFLPFSCALCLLRLWVSLLWVGWGFLYNEFTVGSRKHSEWGLLCQCFSLWILQCELAMDCPTQSALMQHPFLFQLLHPQLLLLYLLFLVGEPNRNPILLLPVQIILNILSFESMTYGFFPKACPY